MANSVSVYGFAMLRTGGGPTYSTTGLDTLYVGDSTAGVTKYLRSGSTWASSGTVTTPAFGLAVRQESADGTAVPVL